MTQIINREEYEVAWLGNLTVNDTDAHLGKWKGFFVTADAVITHIYINGGAVDVQANLFTTPANGVKAGALKTLGKSSNHISEIKLASGQVEMINFDSDQAGV